MSARVVVPPRTLESSQLELMSKTIKGLAMDAVERAASGHPGMPMGMANAASVLWGEFLMHDPSDPAWVDRDRFVLSAGHGSMLLYALLHLTGYDVSIDDLRQFRQWGSKTAGHPEFDELPGVEITTGPLGTGFAAGVGMALAERFLADRYNRDGHCIVDHYTYGIVSDGDLMEGVASEAASLAGHLELGKLIYLYDDNSITIDGPTDLAFSEDVAGRFQAYGWRVQKIDGHDHAAVREALMAARREVDRPTLIVCKTVIAHGSPNKAGTSAAHGAKLGQEEVDATKRGMDWPLEPFHVPDEVRSFLQASAETLENQRRAWDGRMQEYRARHPELAREFEALMAGELPEGLLDDLPRFEPGEQLATRKAGGKVLQTLAERHPTLLGGSADLAESNGVLMKEVGSQSTEQPGGRNVHYGVREHAMAGISNGMALHGGLRVFDATFLVFSDFMRGCLRLSALMRLPVVHVFSHDSVWLGEDGPTHQPVEHVMSLRLMPNLHVVRPADARETVGAFQHALRRKLGDGPTAICVTRQNVPILAETREDISAGGYVLWEPDGTAPQDLHGILLATGSEVALALQAAKRLDDQHGKRVRVVSMPCWEAFEANTDDERARVLPPQVDRRLSIEAGATLGWDRYARHHHGIDRFGASAPGKVVAEKLGMSVDAVVEHYLALP